MNPVRAVGRGVWRGADRGLVAALLGAALLTVGVTAAAAVEPADQLATVQVLHEGASSQLEVCLFDDGGAQLPAEAVLDEVRRAWPLLADLEATEEFDCSYVELPDVRTELASGDGFVAEVTLPPLAGLATASRDVEVTVCTVAIEVTTDVTPASASRGDVCGYGYLGVELDPGVAATVTVIARASDAFLLQRTLLLTALVGLVAVVAFAVSAILGRRVAVRSAGNRWQVPTMGLAAGLAAGIGVVLVGWGLGVLDAWVVRHGMGVSIAVAVAAGVATLAVVLGASWRVAKLRHDPGVQAEARRRGDLEPTLEEVPEDLRDLPLPPPLLVPPAPSWAAVLRGLPGVLLWVAGLGGLVVTEPGALPALALAVAVVGAALTWLLPLTARVGLGAEPISVERERALLAAARELHLPVTTIRRSSVQLPEDDLGPAPALVVGRTLLLSPALDRQPARRAMVVATVGAATVGGLGAAWFGAAALLAGAYLDGPFEALTRWTLLPAVLLVPPTLLWFRTRRGFRRAERTLDPSEVVDASVEMAWLAFRQFAVDDTVVRLEPAELHGGGRYVGKLDDVAGDRLVVDGNQDELAVAWPLVVDSMRDVEAELGAPPGTAEAAARRLGATEPQA